MTAATRPPRGRKREGDSRSRQQPIDAPSAWPDGNDSPGAVETGSGSAGRARPTISFEREAERGAAEDGDDEPRRVVSFAVDQVHHRDHRERDAEHVRVEHIADDLGRLHQFWMSGVDPVERFRGAGVETAEAAPSPRGRSNRSSANVTAATSVPTRPAPSRQPEALVGGGQMALDSPPQPLQHAFSCSPSGG